MSGSNNLLLVDENELRRFLEKVNPVLEKDEVLVLGLAARGKYCPGTEKAGAFLNSEIIRTGNVDEIVLKIRRLSFVEGCYRSMRTGDFIKPECMVLYLDLEPKSVIKALNQYVKEYQDVLTGLVVNSLDDFELIKKFVSWSKMRSALSKSRSRKLYCDVDIDVKDEGVLREVLSIVTSHGVSYDELIVIESRGGYHVVIPNDKKLVGVLYQKYNLTPNVEIHNKQVQVTIPGTLQGGFLVRMDEDE